MANGAEELLLAAFEAGEGIRICLATTNEEGREVPRDQGITLSREEWLHKLEENGGNPNGILRSSANNGIFISVNPLKLGGSKDADVTAYRHALLEFDNISQQEQWNIIVQSGIPCAAVIYSGGKSLHAWVKVDAQDRKEYDERVAILYNHFEAYKPDVKNKNPSRFSRLPNCVRGPKRQELLALKIGAESFSEWMISQDAEDLGQEITIASLLEFRAEEDPNCILGDRWLCRGGSCLFVGQSGIGKSSLAVQAAILWSLDMSLFGIKPKRALRSLFIQAENDLGDIAEMFQGVWQGMNLPGADKPEVIRQVNDNVFFRTIDSLTGYDFTQAVRRLIDKYKPDLVWLDPLLSYIGDDISKQSVCSQFLRNWLNPISKATGVCWMMMHHTNKPPSDPKA
ncbi:MAG TPA: AAA family ATPase, partial [Prosthecobacter sp.]|nr:AAA family ATPase [Prosthecobacter sp.]